MAKLKTGRHTSALKAWRKSEKLASRNRGIKTKIRETSKEFIALTDKKDAVNSQNMLPKAYSLLDKAAKTGALHWKAAARRKSRLSGRLKSATQKPA